MKNTNTLSLVLFVLVGCADTAPTLGLPCPCSTGYVCCGDNVCVPEGDACSMRELMPGTSPTSKDQPCSATEDTNGDNVVDMNWTYLYDGAGRRLRSEGTSPDGQHSHLWTFAYNEIGQTTSATESVDGSELYAETQSYDEMGRMHEMVLMDPDSPTADITSTWSYSGLVATIVDRSPTLPDGVITLQEDIAGHPVSATLVMNGEVAATMTFGVRPDGALNFMETHFSKNNVTDRETWIYNELGQLTEIDHGDIEKFTYDAQGRQLTDTKQDRPTSPPTDIITNHYCN